MRHVMSQNLNQQLSDLDFDWIVAGDDVVICIR